MTARLPLAAVAALLTLAATGCGAVPELVGQDDDGGGGWEERAAAIDGIANYRETDPELLTREHRDGPVVYEVLPPVGGDHDPQWMSCQGDVYAEPVANEHAVHSLEHGAVWLTYRPDLPADQVEALAGRVHGKDKLFLSPFPELDVPISLQAWGYQLKVDDAADGRIDDFIDALRGNASLEGPHATCQGGVTATVPRPDPGQATNGCWWEELPPSDMAVDVGLPPAGVPRQGTQLMTIATNLGVIEVEMDLTRTPCTAASFDHLAGREFFDGSKCHRMFSGIIQCGDPTARGEGYRDSDGQGGPAYRFPDENLPAGPAYPAGVVAMANSGPDTNGSQFFLVYQEVELNGPDYGVVGYLAAGMAVLEQVGAAGHDSAYELGGGGGHPHQELVIESLRVGEPG